MVDRSDKKQTRISALEEAQKLAFAPLTFHAVAAMIDLGILNAIDKKPMSAEELEIFLNSNEYTIKTLLQVAKVIDVVQYNEGKFSLTKKGEAFLYDDMTIANFNFVKDVCYLGASKLTESFCKNRPVGLEEFIGKSETIYPLLPKLDEPMKSSWYNFDNLYSDNCFDKVCEIISSKHGRL